ncbi:hypothetical protein TNCV_1859331 [Trichonephila clavipes]|nr:hypothetical protein TNCV_1859331 [Trichonephila clavipes]
MGRTNPAGTASRVNLSAEERIATFLRSDWPRPFNAEKWAWKWNWVDPKINDPEQGDLELKFKGSHAKIGGENKF